MKGANNAPAGRDHQSGAAGAGKPAGGQALASSAYGASSVLDRQDNQRVAGPQAAAAQHSGEHALGRHDAFAHGLKDLAVAVAFLADLRQLQQHLVAGKTGTDGQSGQVDAIHYQILGWRAAH